MGLLSNRVERDSLKPGDHIYSWRSAYIYAHHGIYVGDDRVIHFTRHGQEVGTGSVLDVFAGSSAPTHVPCDTCAPSEGSHGVLSSCLDCFLAGGNLYRYEYAVSPAFFIAKVRGGCTCAVSGPNDDVVKRANRLLDIGFGRYDVVTNNCEDFAIYCKTGLCVLDRSTMGQSGQAQNASIIGNIVGDRVATVLTAPVRLAATNVCGRAATAIGKFGVSSGRMATVFGRASTAIGKFGVIPGSMPATVIVDFGVYSARRYAADIGVRKDVVRVPVDDLVSYKEAVATEFVQVVEPTIPAPIS